MKLGIVSDLHCNIDGLDRALEAMGAIDALLCLGDSISEYSFSNEVIGRLRELHALTILGNHEEVFLGPAGVREWIGDGAPPGPVWLRDLHPAGDYRAAVAGLGAAPPRVDEMDGDALLRAGVS